MISRLAASVAESGIPPAASIDQYVPTVGTSAMTLQNTWQMLDKAGTGVLNVLLWAAGALLVINIVIKGMNYISAGGDMGKAAAARNGLLNSAVALIFITLTFFIVSAVISFIQ